MMKLFVILLGLLVSPAIAHPKWKSPSLYPKLRHNFESGKKLSLMLEAEARQLEEGATPAEEEKAMVKEFLEYVRAFDTIDNIRGRDHEELKELHIAAASRGGNLYIDPKELEGQLCYYTHSMGGCDPIEFFKAKDDHYTVDAKTPLGFVNIRCVKTIYVVMIRAADEDVSHGWNVFETIKQTEGEIYVNRDLRGWKKQVFQYDQNHRVVIGGLYNAMSYKFRHPTTSIPVKCDPSEVTDFLKFMSTVGDEGTTLNSVAVGNEVIDSAVTIFENARLVVKPMADIVTHAGILVSACRAFNIPSDPFSMINAGRNTMPEDLSIDNFFGGSSPNADPLLSDPLKKFHILVAVYLNDGTWYLDAVTRHFENTAHPKVPGPTSNAAIKCLDSKFHERYPGGKAHKCHDGLRYDSGFVASMMSDYIRNWRVCPQNPNGDIETRTIGEITYCLESVVDVDSITPYSSRTKYGEKITKSTGAVTRSSESVIDIEKGLKMALLLL